MLTQSSHVPHFLVALFGLVLLAGCTTADLRTEELKEEGLTMARAERGRSLLREVASRQGLAAWRAHTMLEYEAVDHWAWGWLSQEWWPVNPQRFHAQMLLGTFTSRAELLNGPKAGTVWGIQHWTAYTRKKSDTPFAPSESDAIEFYLPTLHYFMGLPFRLLRADVLAYAGKQTLNGQTYDLVLVTWDHLAPSLQHDQYLLWIDRTAKRLDMCRYTLRDAFDWAAGTIFFDDYRTVQGVSIPFRQTVTLEAPSEVERPLDENYFHQVVVETARFDATARDELVVDTLNVPDDSKPPGYTPLDPLR